MSNLIRNFEAFKNMVLYVKSANFKIHN
jgi:hypothetical protein